MMKLVRFGLVALKAMCKAGYFLLAAVAAVPLSPVIGLVYIAKWIHADSQAERFVTVYGKVGRPVRCPRSSCASRVAQYHPTASPFSHPAANRHPSSNIAP